MTKRFDFTPKPAPWECFEAEVAAYIKRKLVFFGLDPAKVRLERRKAYFSKDRESNIIFDVSVEARAVNSPEPMLVWLWECKDYPDRNVEVSEIEEFHHKIQQVGAHKGTIATRHGFATGVLALAKTYRIGLLVLSKKMTKMIHYAADTPLVDEVVLEPVFCQTSAGRDLTGLCDDLAMFGQIEARSLGLLPPLAS